MNGPSKHLNWDELGCKDGTPYPFEWRQTRAIQLAEVFEFIRMHWNKPIKIMSAYRTPEWNKKIGGVSKSQHVQGRALDLKPPKDVSIAEFYDTIKAISPMTSIRGIGKYRTFVHVDVRPSEKIAFWQANGTENQTA